MFKQFILSIDKRLYIYSIIEKQWWIFVIYPCFNNPHISPDDTVLHISQRVPFPSTWYLNSILFVLFEQSDRGLIHTSRKRLSCWNFYELWASRFTAGQTFFASVTRKAPFISSFVFNPRTLLDDNLPPSPSDPMAPWKIRHGYRFFTFDRFHFSSLTLSLSLGRFLLEMKLGKMSRLLA